MPELSDASASTVIIACVLAGAIAFILGLAATAFIRRLAARRNLDVRRLPLWRAPLTVLFVVLAVRWVLLAAGGTQRGWPGRAGYILGLVAIAVVGWLLTVVAVVLERAMLARYPEAGLENRRSRHVRTKIILVTRVIQALIVAVTHLRDHAAAPGSAGTPPDLPPAELSGRAAGRPVGSPPGEYWVRSLAVMPPQFGPPRAGEDIPG
jgi:hypothetical protein